MSTQIGEVSINLRLSMAKFANDVQTGSTAVQQASNQMGDAVTGGTGKARESLRLLSEDIGIGLPRGLQSFIAGLPGVGTALNAAFSSVAVLALLDLVVKLAEKLKSLSDATAQAAKEWGDFQTQMERADFSAVSKSIEDSGTKLAGLMQKSAEASTTWTALTGVVGSLKEGFLLLHPEVQNALDAVSKGDPILKKAVDNFRDFTSQVVNLSQTNLPGALDLVNNRLKGLTLMTGTLTDAQKAQIATLTEWEKQLQKAEDDQFLKAEAEQAKAAQQAIDAAWTSYQAFLKIAKQSSLPSTGPEWLSPAMLELIKNPPKLDFSSILPSISVDTVAKLQGGLTSMNQQLQAVKQGGEVADEATQTVIDSEETLSQKIKLQIAILQELAQQGRITSAQEVQGIKLAEAQVQTHNKSWQQLGHTLTNDVSSAFMSVLEGSQSASVAFEKMTQQIIFAIAKMEILKALNDSSFFGSLAGGSLFGGSGGGAATLFGGRAEGGPVDAGTPYWVGERRTPELFVPKTPGTIVPISQIHSGGSGGHTTNIHMEVNTPNADSFGKSQGQLLSDAYRNARVASAQNRGR